MSCISDRDQNSRPASTRPLGPFPPTAGVLSFVGSVPSRRARRVASPSRRKHVERSAQDGGGDAIVAIGVVAGELFLASCAPRASTLRRPGWQSELVEDAASDPFVLDYGDRAHWPCTPRASENVDCVRAFHQDRPLEPSLAAGVVGTYEVLMLTSRTNSSSTGNRSSAKSSASYEGIPQHEKSLSCSCRKLPVMIRRAAVFAVILLGCHRAPARRPVVIAAKPAPELPCRALLHGSWVTASYVENIMRTRSPLHAGEGELWTFHEKPEDGATVMDGAGTHEGRTPVRVVCTEQSYKSWA